MPSRADRQNAPSTMLRGKPLRMVPLPRVATLRREDEAGIAQARSKP
jgi:hypothetical protein